MIESQTIEFKREYNAKTKNTMLAFLNTDGGTLYLGIDDDGTVFGVEGDIDIEARRVANSFRDSVTPDPSGYFKVEPAMREDKYVIVITVERGTAIPYCYAAYGFDKGEQAYGIGYIVNAKIIEMTITPLSARPVLIVLHTGTVGGSSI